MPCQYDEVILGVVCDLADLRVGEGTFERSQYIVQRQVCSRAMPYRDVITFALFDRQRNADDLSSHLLGGGRLCVKRNDLCLVQNFYKVRELFVRVDNLNVDVECGSRRVRGRRLGLVSKHGYLFARLE